MTATMRGLENLARTARGIGDLGEMQLQGQQYLTDQKLRSLQYTGLALNAMQNQAMAEKLKQPVRMSDWIRDGGTLDLFISKGPLGDKGTALLDMIAQTVGAKWNTDPDSPNHNMLVKDGRVLTNMDLAPYRGEIANWVISYIDQDHVHYDQIERYSRASQADPEHAYLYNKNIDKAKKFLSDPMARIQSYQKQQAILLKLPLSTTPESQAQIARLDRKVSEQQGIINARIEASKPQKKQYQKLAAGEIWFDESGTEIARGRKKKEKPDQISMWKDNNDGTWVQVKVDKADIRKWQNAGYQRGERKGTVSKKGSDKVIAPDKALKRISDIEKARATLEKTDVMTAALLGLVKDPELKKKLTTGQITPELKEKVFEAWDAERAYLEQFIPEGFKKPIPKATHVFTREKGLQPVGQ